tara:strand:+ start:144 stop:794 length:651 start_codon:yes stop_codon:yes gene_type:complete
MKNHYKVLGVDNNIKTKDLKNVYKDLFKKIDEANTTQDKKVDLKKKVYESYHFLTDYHSRKSLDEYLESKNSRTSSELKTPYEIVKKSPNKVQNLKRNNLNTPYSSMTYQSPFISILPSILGNSTLDQLDNFSKADSKDPNSKFFMKSVTSKIVPDKNGNMVQEVIETTNNNGKKDEKRYKKNLGEIYQNKNNTESNKKVVSYQPKKNSKNNGFFF